MSASQNNNHQHRASAASLSSQVSSTASGWATWCRKTLFGASPNKDGATSRGARDNVGSAEEEEAEPLRKGTASSSRLALTSEGDAEDSAVEDCPICTTATKGKLCAAVPCKHEACERCWVTWQKQQQGSKQKSCMICAQPITSVNFGSDRRLSKHKGSHFAKIADEAMEEALRSVLRVKNELLEIVEKVDETHEHLSFLLQNAQAGLFDSDSATSIVQVEVVTTHEQLERLLRTTTLLAEVDKAILSLNKAMKDLDSITKLYPELNEWSRSTLLSFAEVLAPTSKERKSTLTLQWNNVGELFNDLLTNRLNVVQAMAMVMPMEGFNLLGMLARARQSINAINPTILAKVELFEAEATRFITRIEALNIEYPSVKEQQKLAAAMAESANKEEEFPSETEPLTKESTTGL